ncbi:FAD-dependent oxidoreductase [Brevundimonas sp.]|uniref:NAD(P)/FAD-dependent oxidoreductase n=1 Tax=Brevundimonas sp. TaxID=1871086 RepID=UPI00262A6B45|nr:FAD-dependent oxidoreductase [Brevundimonas sp.]
MKSFDVLIVGSGHAGAQAAISLRQSGFEGSISIVTDEAHLPYERPPLSKDALSDAYDFEQGAIRPSAFWKEQGIELLLGRRVISIDAEAHTVALDDGGLLGYAKLIWAAGGSPRRLPCVPDDLHGVHYLRNRAHAEAIQIALSRATNIVVVGGGYIGLEVAAALVNLGRTVTLVETSPRLLSRSASEPLSDFLHAEHTRQGVDIRLNAKVAAVEAQDGVVASLTLEDGENLPADLLLIGIGIDPLIDPLQQAGAELGAGGVLVDSRCRTTLPDVYAIGDCAAHVNAYGDGRVLRLESVQNAHDQAAVVAAELVGKGADYDALPWFWSDQYDLKLQTAGLSLDFDRAIVRGDIASRSFSIVYKRDGVVIALDCINAPRDYIQGRSLVTRRSTASDETIADVTSPIKSLA